MFNHDRMRDKTKNGKNTKVDKVINGEKDNTKTNEIVK